MLRFNASPEELNVFLDELEEQLQVLEESIIKLEKEGDLRHVAEIFRVAHTIKGSSASLGYQRMTNLTHIMENLLDKLNRGKLALDPAIVEALFEGLDALKLLKKGIESGAEADVDLETLIQRFEALGGERKQAPGTDAAVRGAKELQEVYARGTEALRQKQNLLDLAVTFSRDCELPIVRAFQVSLELDKHGEVLFSSPAIEELKKGEVIFTSLRILLATREGKPQIEAAVKGCSEVGTVAIKRIAPKQLAAFIAGIQAQGGRPGPEPEEQGEEVSVATTPQRPAAPESIVPELKKASRTVRVSVEILDSLMNLVGELVIDRTRLVQIGTQLETVYESSSVTGDLMETSLHISKITNELQEQIMKARMVSIDMIFNKLPRMVRDLSQKAGKDVNFVVEGGDTELDRAVIEEIGDPLIHLLRNSLDHGIEPPEERKAQGKPSKGLIYLGAYHEENHIVILVRDDGRGIDPERVREKAIQKGLLSQEKAQEMLDREVLDLIFVPGFSTAEAVSDVSGRGVGMDIVKNNLQKIGGSIDIATDVGKGTTFTIRIPLTLAIMQALLVTAKGIVFSVPLGNIAEIVKIPASEVKPVGGYNVFTLRGEVVPLASLVELFNDPLPEGIPELNVVVVSYLEKKVGIIADILMGKQEVVIKTMGQYIGDLPGISGVTILGDGTIGLILDVASFINAVIQSRRQQVRRAS